MSKLIELDIELRVIDSHIVNLVREHKLLMEEIRTEEEHNRVIKIANTLNKLIGIRRNIFDGILSEVIKKYELE